MLKKARRSRTSEEMQCRHAEWFQRTLAYRIIYGFSFLCQLFVIEGGQNCPHATLIAQKEKTSIVTTTWRHPNIPENVPPKINNSLENYEYLQEGHMSFLSTCCLLRISQWNTSFSQFIDFRVFLATFLFYFLLCRLCRILRVSTG